ncbi:MAG: SMC family ATPase [Nocardia sp.]|nr:SMC family ATPase [Nocardia sp.]
MRLHRLEVTAFGPFAETTSVDFDELGADGLFLLHGHTGAGKTTVLDAIAFALYGRVPGARGESKRLHSDHADPQTPPRVRLEATLGGRRLRLTRTPEFERPKKRGTGTRTENASATLEWLDGRGQNLSRIPDIGDVVGQLLGMSADQFFQVVLLPQGEFARFLRSDNEGREKLLERLFDTARFGIAEQWLLERRSESKNQVEVHRQAVDRLVAQVAVTTGLGADSAVDPLDAVAWSEPLLRAAREAADRSALELKRCRSVAEERNRVAEEQDRVAERRRRGVQARRRLDEIAAGASDRERIRDELERSRRVEPVAAALDSARGAAVAARRRTEAVCEIAERLGELLLEPESAELEGTAWAAADLVSAELRDTELAAGLSALPGAERAVDTTATGAEGAEMRAAEQDTALELELFSVDFAASAASRGREGGLGSSGHQGDQQESAAGLESALRAWSAHIGVLAQVRADAEAAGRLSDELAALRSRFATTEREREQVTHQRADLPNRIHAAELAHRRAADTAAGLPGLERECERLRGAAEAATELIRLRGELETATAEFESARTAHNDARDTILSIRERRLAGMAAELAGELTAGQPCAVCGSAEHPAPARPAEHTVTTADEQRAARAERAADQVREQARSRRDQLERRIDVLAERTGRADRAELADALEQTAARLASARTAATTAAESAAEIDRLRRTEIELNDRLRDIESRCSAIQERIDTADRRLAELTGRVRAAAGADGTVDARQARLEALIEDADRLRGARADAEVARDQFATAADRVRQAARTAELDIPAGPRISAGEPDFSQLTAYAEIVERVRRTADRQTELESELAAAERLRVTAEATLAEPEVRAAMAAEPVDLAGLRAAADTARAELDTAVAAHADDTRKVSQLEDLTGQLWAAADRIAPLQRAHRELDELASVVAGRGANNRKMSLRSYVLAARLEEVAIAGSARLRRMSGGRYEFVHSDAAGPRGRRGGLGLDIRDDYTGAVRPAKTLSGGETFMASLSLALGLADVVSAESGGLVLDTLFIDEGFGSLDSDTLDAVMGVLDELRAGGRVVGVVSHVDEMRQRIPSRLHVIREPSGSRLRTVVA